MHSKLVLLSVFCALLSTVACDNVGRAFDRTIDGGGGSTPTGTSVIQVVPEGGDLRDGRPRVKAAFPKGGGWPTTVPIVVEFSESVNEASILPTRTGGTDGKIVVRVKDSTQAIPASYDFVAGGRVLVIRPTPALSNTQNPTYEVVMLPEARDADGVRFQGTQTQQLAEFTVDEAEDEADGRILTSYPRDNVRDAVCETPLYVFFTKAANPASISATTFAVRAGGARVDGEVDLPLSLAGVDDPRIVRFLPEDPFAAGTRQELTVTAGITFGAAGGLDFSGRSPFLGFETVGVQAPTSVEVANPTAGFPGKINRGNVGTLQIKVGLPATTAAGDRVAVRIYGGDRATTATADLAFLERVGIASTAGVQELTIDFAGALGSVDRPEFDDGAVTLAAQVRRGEQHSGFAHAASSQSPRFDVTLPTLREIGPPGIAASSAALTDQDALVFYGTASEEIGAATLTDGTNTVSLFAASADGRLMMLPLPRGALGTAANWSLLLTDKAGNVAAAAETGPIVRRGYVTGTLAGTLTVEAYDDATLLPLAGVRVLVDADAPTVPATSQQAGTTDANGRASFSVAAATQTITLVHPGYHLRTLYRTTAAMVSLPMRPMTNATATFRGTAVMAPTPNVTALIGNSAYDDPLTVAVATTSSAATAIPSTPIRPNRPQVISALSGVFEATAVPAFTGHGCQQLGNALTALTPPAAPAAGGADSTQTVTLLPAAGATMNPLAALTKNFALATGLDTANLVGGRPNVRFLLSLSGFGGQVLFGTGFASPLTGASYSLNGTYSTALSLGLSGLGPIAWTMTEARDTGGRVSRTRAFLVTALGLHDDRLAPPAIPTITAPTGPSTGSPSVEIQDQLAVDVVGNAGFFGFGELLAQDAAGRQWTIGYEDTDAAGGSRTMQFPDLSAAGQAGLAVGNWSVRAEGRIYLSLTSAVGDFVLAERRRMEVTYARSATETFTVQ